MLGRDNSEDIETWYNYNLYLASSSRAEEYADVVSQRQSTNLLSSMDTSLECPCTSARPDFPQQEVPGFMIHAKTIFVGRHV